MRFITYTILFSIFFYSCQDNCDYYSTYIKYNPIYSNMDELRDSVKFTVNREINNPGKLNYKDGYLFISETKKGIHIIDNRNFNNPINIGFINLPGNNDIATKNDFLYADSYMDLVIFDISKIDSVKEVNRVKEAFKNYYLNQGLYSEENGIVVGYDEEVVEEYIENHNCGFIWD